MSVGVELKSLVHHLNQIHNLGEVVLYRRIEDAVYPTSLNNCGSFHLISLSRQPGRDALAILDTQYSELISGNMRVRIKSRTQAR